jgi:hypothetical protein
MDASVSHNFILEKRGCAQKICGHGQISSIVPARNGHGHMFQAFCLGSRRAKTVDSLSPVLKLINKKKDAFQPVLKLVTKKTESHAKTPILKFKKRKTDAFHRRAKTVPDVPHCSAYSNSHYIIGYVISGPQTSAFDNVRY